MSIATPLKLAILISGRGSNMAAIVRACLTGAIAARPFVISDRADAAGIGSARELGVEAEVLSSDIDRSRTLEQGLITTLEARHTDAIALAGFMRILSAPFVARYLGRMLNIHPSLLPAYRGLHTHRRVLAAGDREHGEHRHFGQQFGFGVAQRHARQRVLVGARVDFLAPDLLGCGVIQRSHEATC